MRDFIESLRFAWAYRHNPECMHGIARLTWRLFVVLYIVSLLSFIGLGVWFFISEPKVSDGATVGDPVETLSRETLDTMISDFENRATRFEQIKKESPVFSDPS